MADGGESGAHSSFLAGGGEMGARMRAHDWAATPLGPPEIWPQSLRSMLSASLNCPVLGAVLWGPDLLFLYNDAYIPSLADRHPRALGRPVSEVWGDAWTHVAEPFHRAMRTGEGFASRRVELPMIRRGQLETTWWNFSAAPIRGEDGSVVGLLNQGVEITDQVLTARQLGEERERLAQMFARAHTFMALLEGPEHRIRFANPGYLDLIGGRDVIGRTVEEALPDAVEQGYLGLLDGVFRSGEPYAATSARYDVLATIDAPARERYIDFVYQPIRGAGGVVTGIFVEGVDVTGRTLADRVLRENEQRLKQALSAGSGIGTWDWDVAADIVRADDRFARLYGVDPAVAAQGAPIEDFFRRIYADDLDRLRIAINVAIETGEPFSEEYRILDADDETVWLTARGRCERDDTGQPTRFPGVSFDISDRRNAETRQAALLELGDVLRGLNDPDEMAYAACAILGRTLDVSRIGYGIVDRAKETISIDRDWNAPGIRTLAGVLRFRDYGSYIDNLLRGEAVTIADTRQDERTRASSDVLEAISARAFVNMPLVEQGGFVALIYANHAGPRRWSEDDLLLMRDVAERVRAATERVRADAARRESEARLRLLNDTLEQQVTARTTELMASEEALRQSQKMEAVGQLTGGIAHDFNNLLTGITGSLEMMGMRIAQGRLADVERYSLAAQGAAKRAAALTHRLLAFSRRQTLDPKPTDVNRLVADMEELIRRTVGPETTLEVVTAGGLWSTRVDPNQLENALLNLCINARDAMPEGGRLTIETGNRWLDQRGARDRDLDPGQYVSLCVSDSGTGMTPEVIVKAFDPFFTTKPLGLGTGLGLSMIYGFARQSGGQVRIYSEVGEGTMVCLYLPRHLGPAEVAERAPELTDAPRADAGETVLVVDDEPTIRMLVIEVLEELGYAAIEAADGAAGLKLLDSDIRIDLLVTDVGLPGGMNGRQMADAARIGRPDLKVLFITGYAENAVVGNGHLDPGMHLLTKPFALEALASRISELIADV